MLGDLFGSSRKQKEQTLAAAGRLPPGQYVTEKWPVLHYGPVPRFDSATWDFRIFGEVEYEVKLTYPEFRALPRESVKSDVHCVTAWSMFDGEWEGVPFKEVMALTKVKPTAKFVMAHCEHGFTANVPLAALLDDRAMFVDRHNGEDITAEHGWPLRLFVPQLYFWKSAKWVRGIEFMAVDRRGFWEQNGYHNNADPWKEERYSDD